jgi:nitrous oxidase accessory protein
MRLPAAVVVAILLSAHTAQAVRSYVAPGTDLSAVLLAAGEGDTLVLLPGMHAGPALINRRITLLGRAGAVLQGDRSGSVLTIHAPGTVVCCLAVQGSGRRVLTADAGIKVTGASGVRFEDLELRDNLYGIYLENSPDARVSHCHITGPRDAHDEGSSGNGIHLWFSPRVAVESCQVDHQLDGIYISFSSHVRVRSSVLEDNIRYGLHYMNCQDNDILENTFQRNTAGCAIMFSNHLRVNGNDFVHNRGSRTYGLLLRSCSDGLVESNRFQNNTIAVFMDDSNRNQFHGNLLAENGWGLYLFSSSEENEFWGNDFIQNDYPVALDMRRTQNRFDNGRRGNYWSDSAPYDLDGDGIGDAEFGPVGAFAFLSKQYPDLALFAQSPAIQALGAAERAFPALRPADAVDRHPALGPTTRTPKLHSQSHGVDGPLLVGSLLGLLMAGASVLWGRV